MKKTKKIKGIEQKYLIDLATYTDSKGKIHTYDSAKGWDNMFADLWGKHTYNLSQLFPHKDLYGLSPYDDDFKGFLFGEYYDYQTMCEEASSGNVPTKFRWVTDEEAQNSFPELLEQVISIRGVAPTRKRVVVGCLKIEKIYVNCSINNAQVGENNHIKRETVMVDIDHHDGCACCQDTTDKIKKRQEKFMQEIDPKYGYYRGLSDSEVIETNKQNKVLGLPLIQKGARATFIYFDMVDEWYKYIKLKSECSNCNTLLVKRMYCPCKNAVYCDEICQKKDWSKHKKEYHIKQ